MRTLLKKIYHLFLIIPIRTINQIGDAKRCYVCKRSFSYFTNYQGGSKNIPIWFKKLEIIGSDSDNFGCQFCGSHDRERHLFMYFDKLNLWEKLKDWEILHFAPELNLSKKIEQSLPIKYVKGDLFSQDKSIQEIDATDIPFKDATFNIVICNHVLEHIPNYMKALKEIYRVLKPNGIAILQTPYSSVLLNNFEDNGINTKELRLLYYGQEDHVRIFSEKQFIQSLKVTGFILDILKHEDFLKDKDSEYFGVNKNESLIMVTKPGN